MENEDQISYQNGATYIAAFQNFIPRSLWKNKPFGAGPLMKNYVSKNKYSINNKYRGSLTTGLLTELKMNFNGFIYFVFLFLYGVSISALLKSYLTRSNFYLKLIQLIILIGFTFLILYSEFLGLITRIFCYCLPILFLYYISIKTINETNHTIL
ncbi:hypothetical protein [Nonlabens tegetincola]|uniref:hypothetical protein n=1 Tax=Nonlabens tegetincola TaxID=323273 RepID=UPI003743C5E9